VSRHVEATRVLIEADPRLAAWIERFGACGLPTAPNEDSTRHFRGLVKAIVSQQLSSKAAETIFGRVEALADTSGELSSSRLRSISVSSLREAGLSGMKASFVHDLAERVENGSLDLGALGAMSDDEAIDALIAVKGIGRWTAQMFLMFDLARPDVFAVDDLGLKKGMARLLRARKPLEKERMEKVARRWAPHRSVASWYLWRISESPED
jgi:DNA-3-methyladenine glycosylase II